MFSFSYIKHQISTTTVGPLYDFGLSIIIILGLLLGLTFIAYYFMILLYRIDETAGELRELISRQKAAIAEMAPYIAEESDSA